MKKKYLGWILLSIGSVYPTVLALMGLLWIGSYVGDPNSISHVRMTYHYVNSVIPGFLISSFVLCVIGLKLIRRSKKLESVLKS